MNITILGAGISGISAAYHLGLNGKHCVIFEKSDDWGGLCGNFNINGFRFDKFVHLSFADDPYIKELFASQTPLYEHPSLCYNYYKGFWLKHPAQNNLAPLPNDEKVKIITDFISRPKKKAIKSYDEWLICQYGEYFAKNFPFKYTRKYWCQEPSKLETKWIGARMYQPSLEQILKGSFEVQKDNFYYTNFMRYPKNGGFASFFAKCKQDLNINFNKEVIKINPKDKILYFSDNTTQNYDKLISSLPLPYIAQIIDNVPKNVLLAAQALRYTSGFMLSLGFNRPDIPKWLWFYIYDDDILCSRVHSPSLKSPNNAPKGCSSLQAEIYFDCKAKIPNKNLIAKNTIEKLSKMGLFDKSDIILSDIRFEKYANITFDHKNYKNRKIVLDFLAKNGIESIGRFGKWEYLWSHQAFKSGMEVALKF